MKKLFNFLISSRLMAIIIVIFALSIGIATFIENDFGSQTARAVIYNAWWFEALLFIGIINLVGTIFIKQLYLKGKFSIFLFHLSFLFILTGAAVTRYFSFEGSMHIRQGQTQNQIVSDNCYLSASVNTNNRIFYNEKNIYISSVSDNSHRLKLNVNGKALSVEIIKIITNAQEKIISDNGGKAHLELVFSTGSGRKDIILAAGRPQEIDNVLFSINDSGNTKGLNFLIKGEDLFLHSGIGGSGMNMADQSTDSIIAGELKSFQLLKLYNFSGLQFVAKSFIKSGRTEVISSHDAKPDELPEYIQLKLKWDNEIKYYSFFAQHNILNNPVKINFNNIIVNVSYGTKLVILPFYLQLNKFVLERYPGSNSPSWFESKIKLVDSLHGINEDHSIFMNNVLKYNGYRFYQSSYDMDEQGTILSVNHDFWGTAITYIGYLLMALGMIWSIFNKKSRFQKLSTELSQIRQARKTLYTLLFILFSTTIGFSQENRISKIPDNIEINKDQASKFGQVLIQDMGGRIKPVNSLSSELVRKICRSTTVLNQSSDQVILGMMTFPEFWQKVPMIKIGHPEISKALKIEGTTASFIDFLSKEPKHEYLLDTYVRDAFQKKPASRSKFDNEVIRVDERVSLCYLIYTGELLKIFPKPNDEKNNWYSPIHAASVFKGNDSIFTTNIFSIYLKTLRDGCVSKKWELSDKSLEALKTFQYKYGRAVIPSESKIKAESFFNQLNLFEKLGSVYGLVGFVLLLMQLYSVFKPKIKLDWIINTSKIILFITFILHLAGLATRWYISGHAPWSNAYESLIYISFATVLAGIVFSRKSGFALSATALIAWLILFTAHLSWMDPEITNLVPVLKSYWLLIHVAVITASYGFLALVAILALINLCLMVFQTKENFKLITSINSELNLIIEMSLIIGLYMLTIGTFLGGVWANESWGRYWGWDPKETWALVSVLIYAFVAHVRLIPGLKSSYILNLFSLIAFSSIIMTYFGVNYYLSGLHSYAKGDPMPIPVSVYYSLGFILVLAILSYRKYKRFAIK